MTTLLSEFDDRLARLEKSLVPIHKQTGRLTRVSKSKPTPSAVDVLRSTDRNIRVTDIEVSLRSIDGLLGHHDLVERESPLISQGYAPMSKCAPRTRQTLK